MWVEWRIGQHQCTQALVSVSITTSSNDLVREILVTFFLRWLWLCACGAENPSMLSRQIRPGEDDNTSLHAKKIFPCKRRIISSTTCTFAFSPWWSDRLRLGSEAYSGLPCGYHRLFSQSVTFLVSRIELFVRQMGKRGHLSLRLCARASSQESPLPAITPLSSYVSRHHLQSESPFSLRFPWADHSRFDSS